MAFGGESAESYYDEGLTASMKGDMAHAIGYFRKAIQLDRGFLAAQHQLGRALTRIGRNEDAVGLLREVVLLLDQQPCIYAQSFLPDHTVAALQPLATLGAVPLGHYIFTQPELSRSAIEIADFAEGLQLPGLGVLPQLWGRRSYFTLSQHELLVQELYLPALTEFIRV